MKRTVPPRGWFSIGAGWAISTWAWFGRSPRAWRGRCVRRIGLGLCTAGAFVPLGAADKVLIELYRDGVCIDEGDLTAARMVVSSSDTAINLSGFHWNNRTVPDGDWWDAYPDSKLIVVKNGIRYEHPITFKGE